MYRTHTEMIFMDQADRSSVRCPLFGPVTRVLSSMLSAQRSTSGIIEVEH